MWRDAGLHRSPNAGWPEAAMAAGLNVRLSGPRVYADRVAEEPWVNAGAPDPTAGRSATRPCALCPGDVCAGSSAAGFGAGLRGQMRDQIRDHGGNIDGAIARFGGADWIDLSTGINRVPYPMPAYCTPKIGRCCPPKPPSKPCWTWPPKPTAAPRRCWRWRARRRRSR